MHEVRCRNGSRRPVGLHDGIGALSVNRYYLSVPSPEGSQSQCGAHEGEGEEEDDLKADKKSSTS